MTNNKLTDEPMSLDAAITHADERAASLSGPCAAQHAQLAAWLRELQERRKADSEPVADVVVWSSPNEERTCDIRWRRFDVAPGPLYTAPPAPVVPEEAYSDDCPDLYPSQPDAWAAGWNACRAAMLKGGAK